MSVSRSHRIEIEKRLQIRVQRPPKPYQAYPTRVFKIWSKNGKFAKNDKNAKKSKNAYFTKITCGYSIRGRILRGIRICYSFCDSVHFRAILCPYLARIASKSKSDCRFEFSDLRNPTSHTQLAFSKSGQKMKNLQKMTKMQKSRKTHISPK